MINRAKLLRPSLLLLLLVLGGCSGKEDAGAEESPVFRARLRLPFRLLVRAGGAIPDSLEAPK